jgi:hypothetical protein
MTEKPMVSRYEWLLANLDSQDEKDNLTIAHAFFATADSPTPTNGTAVNDNLDPYRYSRAQLAEESNRYKKVSAELSRVFNWSVTPQGDDYWLHVYQHHFIAERQAIEERIREAKNKSIEVTEAGRAEAERLRELHDKLRKEADESEDE